MSSVHIVQLDTGLCFCRQKCLYKNKLLQIQNQYEAFLDIKKKSAPVRFDGAGKKESSSFQCLEAQT